MTSDIWERGYSVHITSFWGWSPETWGTVGYTAEGRRASVRLSTTDPFLVAVYVTKQARNVGPDTKGRITGFYLVSHVEGDRDQFTASSHHGRDPEKWRHSFKALRAFSYLPEYRMRIDEFDPSLARRARAVAQYGEEVSPARCDLLKTIPFVEVPMFGGGGIEATIQVPAPARGKVRAGPVNRSGFFVPGEPPDTEKELYVLALEGDTSAYLGEPANGRRIYKVGLSISPKARLEALQNAMPRGAFRWTLARSTRLDGDAPYAGFEAAVAGENAMKLVLEKTADWLRGEFYAATDSQMRKAWDDGRRAARGYRVGQGQI